MRIRHNVYLDVDVSDALAAMASQPGASKSAIMGDALRAWISSRAVRPLDDILRTRLDRIDRELRQNKRDLGVLLESLSLFIRHQLTIAPPLPDDDPVAKAIGRDRFEAFIAQVGRQLALGSQSLSRGQPSQAER